MADFKIFQNMELQLYSASSIQKNYNETVLGQLLKKNTENKPPFYTLEYLRYQSTQHFLNALKPNSPNTTIKLVAMRDGLFFYMIELNKIPRVTYFVGTKIL